jgi:AraC-like DNA-binding protein/quercetin dioxygenase-like cupin family protein
VKTIPTRSTGIHDLDWLAKVMEVVHPLNEQHPIFVRHGVVRAGPAVPSPQRHPFCQMSFLLDGQGIEYIEGDEAPVRAGDMVLIGPEVPHWHQITHHPHRFATVYFLPAVIVGFGAGEDSMRMLHRVTAHQPLSRRVLRPPAPLRRRFQQHLAQMIAEFHANQFGVQLVLKAHLYEMLVALERWEQRHGTPAGEPETGPVDLKPLQAAIAYIGTHFYQPIYAHQLAKAAGVEDAALKKLFHDVLKMTWVQYLQGYRVRQASLLLSTGSHNVTEASLAAGFESLSHFNATFRRILGVSPRHFLSQRPAAE